jgi:alpha-mannosidase
MANAANFATSTEPTNNSGVPQDEPTLYVVGCSHLDTQWWWTIQETIDVLLAPTFEGTFSLFEKFPDFRFSWEGAFRYALLKEYYPEVWERLIPWVQAGRWAPSGSAWDANDVNVPSAESLARNFLYGNGFFKRELGITSRDVFLPDCFGFGYALPTVAAHFGLTGFSTQKLTWGSSVGIPFDIGVWEGIDGSSLVAALNPGAYVHELTYDISATPRWVDTAARQEAASGLPLAFAYFGVGDRGGSVSEGSLENLAIAINEGSGPLRVKSAFSDDLMRDLSPEQIAALPRYKGEMLMTSHGVGCYTSQAAMKRWNRRNELLADAAERAAVAANHMGDPYPIEDLTDAWQRFLWHQFHDDLTGTSIPQAYVYSWNDELLVHNRLAAMLTHAVGSMSMVLDTRAEGVPLVVYNPLEFGRTDVVEAVVRFGGYPPVAVQVFGPDGTEVPSQVLESWPAQDPAGSLGVAAEGRSPGEAAVKVAFLATVPAGGFATFDVRPATGPSMIPTGLSATVDVLESPRYRVQIGPGGDVTQIRDKLLGRDLLASPLRLDLFDDIQIIWPAWEIPWEALREDPRETLGSATYKRVIESGPARVAVEVRRDFGASSMTQRIRLAADGERIEFDTEIDWWESMTLMKASFPLAAANPMATFDLGVGRVRRGIHRPELYEVPAQLWVNQTAGDESFGVTVTTDSRYGWDKPDDQTLRLTLLHTPLGPDYDQHRMDMGHHKLLWALAGHSGHWRDSADRVSLSLNQPLLAFQVPPGTGERLGRTLSTVSVQGQARLMAVKAAEEGHELVVRVVETGEDHASDVRIDILGGVIAAREILGSEEPLPDRGTLTGPASVSRAPQIVDNGLVFDLHPFQVRTFAITLGIPSISLPENQGKALDLPWNRDVVSPDSDRTDGDLDGSGHSIPAELFPGTVNWTGVRFALGPAGPGDSNAVACTGQRIPISSHYGDRVYLLAAAQGDVDTVFRVGDLDVPVSVQGATGLIGQWDSRVVDGELIRDMADLVPAFYKPDTVAWYATHLHRPEGNVAYQFAYLFQYVLPVPEGATELVLPDDSRVMVFAATQSNSKANLIVAATSIHDGHSPLHETVSWPLPLVEPEPDPEPIPDEATFDVTEPPDNGVDSASLDTPVQQDSPGDGTSTPDAHTPDNGPGKGGGCSSGAPSSTPWPLVLLLAACLGFLALAGRRTRPRC